MSAPIFPLEDVTGQAAFMYELIQTWIPVNYYSNHGALELARVIWSTWWCGLTGHQVDFNLLRDATLNGPVGPQKAVELSNNIHSNISLVDTLRDSIAAIGSLVGHMR